MAKHLIYGLFAMALASSALASEHYIEVWNPPEAHGAAVVRPQPKMHKAPKHHRVSFAAAHRRAQHRLVVSTPAALAPTPAATAASQARPTFNDIPRQITPEGNVLRVTSGGPQVAVER